jgi:hypothetical protein
MCLPNVARPENMYVTEDVVVARGGWELGGGGMRDPRTTDIPRSMPSPIAGSPSQWLVRQREEARRLFISLTSTLDQLEMMEWNEATDSEREGVWSFIDTLDDRNLWRGVKVNRRAGRRLGGAGSGQGGREGGLGSGSVEQGEAGGGPVGEGEAGGGSVGQGGLGSGSVEQGEAGGGSVGEGGAGGGLDSGPAAGGGLDGGSAAGGGLDGGSAAGGGLDGGPAAGGGLDGGSVAGGGLDGGPAAGGGLDGGPAAGGGLDGGSAAGGGLDGGGHGREDPALRRRRILADHVQLRLLKEDEVTPRRRASVERSVEFLLVQGGIIVPTEDVPKVGTLLIDCME